MDAKKCDYCGEFFDLGHRLDWATMSGTIYSRLFPLPQLPPVRLDFCPQYALQLREILFAWWDNRKEIGE